MWRAVILCSGSPVEPNWLAAHIKEADFSPKRRLMSSFTLAMGDRSFPFTCPTNSSKNSPHLNLWISKNYNMTERAQINETFWHEVDNLVDATTNDLRVGNSWECMSILDKAKGYSMILTRKQIQKLPTTSKSEATNRKWIFADSY